MRPTTTADTQRLDDVLKIAVLRGGGLGDLIFTLPAIDALAEAYPEAEIVLLGTPLHRELLEERSGPIARVEVLPRARGVFGSEDAEDPRGTEGFFRRMAGEKFDLACQLHGGGRWSNPFVQRLQARHTVGTRTPDAEPLERCLPYLYYQHEVIRWLETVALVGATSVGTEATLSVALHERLLGLELAGDGGNGLAIVHPGATDPRRRWPAERFTELCSRLAREGMRVLLIGDGADAALADDIAEEVARESGGDVQSLAGRITLPELAGLLSVADVFIGNDSGPRHLAQAVGTATVGIFWFGNVLNGGPLTRRRHRVQMSWTTHCPTCGADATQVGWTAERCEHDDSFVAGVPLDAVYGDVRDLVPAMARTVRLRGT